MARMGVCLLVFWLGGCASYDPESGRYISRERGDTSLEGYRCRMDPLTPNCAYLMGSPVD